MKRCLLAIAFLILPFTTIRAAEPDAGILPLGPDGKPLNLDFETGTLKDWKAEGQAFNGQPIKGDTVSKRRANMKSGHQGDYWIGGWEKKGDNAKGTLTSAPFIVTHPWCSFLVGGGPFATTCVEIVRADNGQLHSRTSGLAEEDMRRVAIDLKPLMGKEIVVRLVDKQTGHWGHINFDDFRFHASKPDLPPRPAPREAIAATPNDEYKYAGLPPEKSAKVMSVPEGFSVTLFAGEPDVHQPIAFCIDDRGRLWVAEAYCYPSRKPYPGILLPENERKSGDRILIFEDTDGDGKFDKKTVFMEGFNLLSGIELGFGGVWVGAAPYFAFIPVDASGDKPAGPPQILLDGWGLEDTHETLNTFTWGPDGWLYGCHGVFTHSRVGKPGTPDNERIPINAGIWRYHPTRHQFEVFAHGTSNPWGLDFDEHGQIFVEACVIPHCFHIIQGARYHRQAGSHFNPYTYADIPTIADHLHFVGATPHSGNNRSDSVGGGHAHCGLMCYLGGAWPETYRGKLFMGNIHGKRINVDIPHAKGSGFVASHGKDFLLANDEWARFINLKYGPDGNVYLIDWYDKQACHDKKQEIWDRSNGRIYKVSYRGTKPVVGVDLTKKSNQELAELATISDNDWYVRHARRILQERGRQSGKPLANLGREILKSASDTRLNDAAQLRALWAAHVLNCFDDPGIRARFLSDASAWKRAWAIQLGTDACQGHDESWLRQLAQMARDDGSPLVRLYLASATQRLPASARWDIVEALAAHGEDAKDHNLPLMVWYAAEPLAVEDPARALKLAANAKLPQLLPFMVRRIAAIGSPVALTLLVDHIGKIDDPAAQRTLLSNINESLKGKRRLEMPAGWPAVYAKLRESKDGEIQSQAMALALTFGDPQVQDALRAVLMNSAETPARRLAALASLDKARDPKLASALHKLIADSAIRGAAIRALAGYEDPATPALILEVYPKLTSAERRDALNTLAARPTYATAMMNAIAAKSIPSGDVTADIVRNLRNLKNEDVNRRITEVWGAVRDTAADRAAAITKFKKKLSAKLPNPPDVSHGRAIFAKTCQQCHTLYGVGSKIGPDITGANRSSLDYVLENILDPSAVIPKEYAATAIHLKNGRTLIGIIRDENASSLTIHTANESLVVPLSDISEREPSANSMMPDDLLKNLNDTEVRALVAYLQSTKQSPILANADNVKEFFNGKDLTGWIGDPKLWSVENGEIVGRSPGIKRNAFLVSDLAAKDFRLSLKIKLTPNKENSGIQFRSVPLADGEMLGPQADAGAGWWGKLYEEGARGLLWKVSGEKHVKPDDWNDYVIEAVGSHVQTWINGKLCVDLDDPLIAKRGVFGLQIHSGGPLEVRFKDLKLELR